MINNLTIIEMLIINGLNAMIILKYIQENLLRHIDLKLMCLAHRSHTISYCVQCHLRIEFHETACSGYYG